jgi:CelD/BcsL family acetyltransferase involved in cellulose biosynthesis
MISGSFTRARPGRSRAGRQTAPDATPALPPQSLAVEERSDLDLAGADRAALDTMIDARPHVGVFLSTAWLSGFLAEPPDRTEPRLLLMREGATLRGVLPLAIERTRRHARVSLLGGGWGSDRVDLLAARGCETACADLFVDWLTASFGPRGFVLELRDVPSDSPLWSAIHRAGLERRGGLALVPREIYPAPYLDLHERGARLSGDVPTRASASLARHRRWLERRGRLRIETLREAGEVTTAFESLIRLLRARWQGCGGSVLDAPRVQRFHGRVLPRLLDAGRLRMIRVSADMRPIAVYYGLAAAGWWGYYLASYDREWAGRIHLGRIMLATAIDLAAQEGATEFDFLRGAERIKYLWPVRERVTIDADVFSRERPSQLLRAARSAYDTAVAVARTLAPSRPPSPLRGIGEAGTAGPPHD